MYHINGQRCYHFPADIHSIIEKQYADRSNRTPDRRTPRSPLSRVLGVRRLKGQRESELLRVWHADCDLTLRGVPRNCAALDGRNAGRDFTACGADGPARWRVPTGTDEGDAGETVRSGGGG